MTWFLDDLLARHARDAGGEIALVDGATILTWAELDARATAVAASLAGAGVVAGDRVALMAAAGADGVTGLLGILRAGAVAAPVPSGLTSREVAVALEVLKPSLVLRPRRDRRHRRADSGTRP